MIVLALTPKQYFQYLIFLGIVILGIGALIFGNAYLNKLTTTEEGTYSSEISTVVDKYVTISKEILEHEGRNSEAVVEASFSSVEILSLIHI